jgi:hypothetical protein
MEENGCGLLYGVLSLYLPEGTMENQENIILGSQYLG